jgi:hypothetical protein
MPVARFVVPFASGAPVFPGVPEFEPGVTESSPRVQSVSWVILSYAPPPADAPQYVLVELKASAANIAILTVRPECLFLCDVTEQGFTADSLTGAQRNSIRVKIESMGFVGAQYGLLNAAIQASSNRAELVVKLSLAAFYRSADRSFMTELDVLAGAMDRR